MKTAEKIYNVIMAWLWSAFGGVILIMASFMDDEHLGLRVFLVFVSAIPMVLAMSKIGLVCMAHYEKGDGDDE